MPAGINKNLVKQWQSNLANGHTETWLATAITLWGIAVIAFAWWLVATGAKAAKWILAAILLYEVLP